MQFKQVRVTSMKEETRPGEGSTWGRGGDKERRRERNERSKGGKGEEGKEEGEEGRWIGV